MLAKCVLISPPRGERNHWRDTLSFVRARMKRWRDGDIVGLWSEVLEEKRRLTQRRRPKKENSELLHATNPRRARRAIIWSIHEGHTSLDF